jgi:hypothetical protein
MKKFAVAVALVLGASVLGIGSSADAYHARRARVVVAPVGYVAYPANPWRHFSAARYIACRNQVTPGRAFSPAYLFMIDACYLGLPW